LPSAAWWASRSAGEPGTLSSSTTRTRTTDRLVAELVAALESWLADRGGESLRVTLGDRSRTVSPSAPDLPGALQGRLSSDRSPSSNPI
jgi:hypothetical protein